MCVRNIITGYGAFPGNLTYSCHDIDLQLMEQPKNQTIWCVALKIYDTLMRANCAL